MARVSKFTMEDLFERLPPVKPIDSSSLSGIDVFFTSLGFEERCLAAPSLLPSGIEHAIALVPGTNPIDNETNRTPLLALLAKAARSVKFLDGESTALEAEIISAINLVSSTAGNEIHIAVDVSAMPSRIMSKIVSIALTLNGCLTVVYTMAKGYLPEREEFVKERKKYCSEGAMTTEEGVEDVTPSIAHAGQHLDPLPACIVLFPNFRRERSRAVISSIDESLLGRSSDQLVWLLSKPFAEEFEWRLDATRLVNGIAESDVTYNLDVLDYRDTMLYLEKIYLQYWKSRNISISPLGTKMQRLGVLFFNYCRPSTRLVFSSPRKYSAGKWSYGTGMTYCTHFPSISQLRENLLSLGQLRINDA